MPLTDRATAPFSCNAAGDTLHFEVIADSVTKGLMDVGLSSGLPVIFGVLTVNTEEQATARSTGTNNHGCAPRHSVPSEANRALAHRLIVPAHAHRLQWGKAAVEMALLRQSAVGKRGRKNFLGFGDEDESSSKNTATGKIAF